MRTGVTLTSRFLSELLNMEPFCSMVPFCLFCLRVARVFWPAAGRRLRRVLRLNFRDGAFWCILNGFRMLLSAISAFRKVFYHFRTRPEWRERAPGVSLRNFGFGAESARCALVEFSAHFAVSKLTFGAPLADLEAKNIRLINVWFMYDFCMRWNRPFSYSPCANGQVGMIFGWVLESFFDGCGDRQMTPGALLGPIGRPGGKKWIILSIRLSKNFSAKWKQSKSRSEVW